MYPLNNIPQLDLHGIDSEYAKILINEFIDDNYKMKNISVRIIHGNGKGILRKTTLEILRKNKHVKKYELDMFNSGSTIVEIEENN